jgi:hypothetical protein
MIGRLRVNQFASFSQVLNDLPLNLVELVMDVQEICRTKVILLQIILFACFEIAVFSYDKP